jgi:hypothetical protein
MLIALTVGVSAKVSVQAKISRSLLCTMRGKPAFRCDAIGAIK